MICCDLDISDDEFYYLICPICRMIYDQFGNPVAYLFESVYKFRERIFKDGVWHDLTDSEDELQDEEIDCQMIEFCNN